MSLVSYVFSVPSKPPARRDCGRAADEGTDVELTEWTPYTVALMSFSAPFDHGTLRKWPWLQPDSSSRMTTGHATARWRSRKLVARSGASGAGSPHTPARRGCCGSVSGDGYPCRSATDTFCPGALTENGFGRECTSACSQMRPRPDAIADRAFRLRAIPWIRNK